MYLKEFAPWVLLSPLGTALVSLHLFLIFSGGGGSSILVWSPFQFSSGVIAPALCLWRIPVKWALRFIFNHILSLNVIRLLSFCVCER